MRKSKKIKKDVSLIPYGPYCYGFKDGKRCYCPYLRDRSETDSLDVHEQESGYCLFLETGDYEMNRSMKYTCEWDRKNSEHVGKEETAEEIGIPLSLLWDACKMCGENYDLSDNYDIEQN